MYRREFIKKASLTTLKLGFLSYVISDRAFGKGIENEIKDYLSKIIYTKKEIDDWFAGKAFPYSKYHSQFGWLLNNNVFNNGINKSASIYTYSGQDGERIMTNYAHKPCRINTYGNSFTHCDQVSDNETWQEVLAAHIQEPVRNFGIGGWSVYQAYLRMLFEEKRKPSDLIIFTIYEDDHLRNLDSWRNIRNRRRTLHIQATLPYVKIDLQKKVMKEFDNPCPTKDFFYKLCDIEETYRLFKDDFVLHIMLAHQKSTQINPDQYNKEIKKFSATHGIETKIDTSVTLSETANLLHRESGLLASRIIIEKIEDFALRNNKKVLYVLAYPTRYFLKYASDGERWDMSFINFLNEKKLPYLDLFDNHFQEFDSYKIGLSDYLNQYFIGHYNPQGNFFFAWKLKNRVIEMLDPNPLPYARKV